MNSENLNSHPLFEKISQFEETIQDNERINNLNLDDLNYLSDAIKFIRDRLNIAIPTLITENELDLLNNDLTHSITELNYYLDNNNIGHINNSKNNIGSALVRAKGFPLILSKGDFNFSKNIQTLKNNYKQILEQQEKEQQKILDTQTKIKNDLADNSIKITRLASEFEQRETDFEKFKENWTTELQATRAYFESEFDKKFKEYQIEIETKAKDHVNILEKHEKNFDNLLLEEKKKFDTNSNKIITELNNKLDEAKKIVNIVGNVGVTGNYQNIANQHKKSANLFRIIALGFMTLMSLLIIWSIIELSLKEFDFYKTLTRIIAAAILTYPSVYASRESTKHRLLENRNRMLELELASLGPFIELLDDGEKTKIKVELVNKYFGNKVEETINNDEDVSVNALEKILKTILPYIKK